MKFSTTKIATYGFCALGLGALAATPGCDNNPVADVCDISCDANAFVQGNAAISGIPSVDAFFGAALDVQSAGLEISGGLRAELDAIAVSVGLEPGASGAEIAAEVNAMFEANLEGGITIDFKPPSCQASVEATAAAAAECDVEVEPGEVTVACEGSCEVEAGVAVDCGAEAQLKCTGTAPNLECSGTCEGSCSLDFSAGGTCEGTCNGTCDAECSLTDAQGNCVGECSGTCTGECEMNMEAGATCEGRCGGECTYDAPEGGCEASASASCEAMAGGSVECSGGCSGNVTQPSVSAECEATVEAKAEASVECNPPELVLDYQLAGSVAGDLEAKATFNAWLEGFKGNLSAIIALQAKGDVLVRASGKLTAAGGAALGDFFQELSLSGDIKASFGGACAVTNLPDALGGLADMSTDLSASVSASTSFLADLNI